MPGGYPCLHVTYIPYCGTAIADEIMQKMWDEEVMGIVVRDKSLKQEETFSARKVTKKRRYANGRYEVAIHHP